MRTPGIGRLALGLAAAGSAMLGAAASSHQASADRQEAGAGVRRPLQLQLSAPQPSTAVPRPPVGSTAHDTAVDDARRAAAGRLLEASRFRERQSVLLADSIHAAQGDLTSECVDRAATGQSLPDCRATASTDLTAQRSEMLDEIMAASQTIYARRFSAAEMDEITRFFRTPVGRKYGALYPQLIADVQTRKAAIARRYLVRATRAKAGGGVTP